MTWFRVGGAGVPASLKNGMNAVLNKKFGTSGQNYPPKQWPDDVNLLGPLPEKTVAGAIAHTDDAADTVPVKSMICSIVPKQAGTGTPSPTNVRALSGYTGLTASQRGKNLLDTSAFDSLEYYTVNADGSITVNSSDSRSWANVPALIFLKAGTYTLSRSLTGSQCYIRSSLDNYASNVCSLGNTATEKNFTLSEDAYIKVKVGYNGTYPFTDSYLLEVGSSASSFEAYNAAADISDSWSSIGAIYGGERDLTLGTLKKTYELIELKVSDMNNSENYPGWRSAGVRALGISTGYYTSWLNIGSGFSVNVSSSNDILFLPTGDYGMTQSQWVANYPDLTVQILVPVGSPTEYTNLSKYDFETLYAVNNFFSDIVGGQTQVTYRQDIDLALQAVSSSRGLMMASRPVTQLVGEESDPDQVNELVEDDENDIPEQLNEVVENDETEQEGEDDAR